MKGILVFLLAGVASPALAQHSGHAAPAAAAPQPACTPEHAAMGHCKLPPPAPVAQPRATHSAAPPQQPQQPACTPEHAAMGHCTTPDPAPQATPATDPHAGHMGPPTGTAPAAGGGPHFGHVESGRDLDPPRGAPPPEAFSGPEHAADLVYDDQRMAAAREEMRRTHGDLRAYRIFFDRIEARARQGRDGYLVEGQAWYGGDLDKIWFKTEIEGVSGENPDEAEIQALWGHAIDPWFDLQTGVRYDPRSGPDRAHLVLGVQGLAPYWWEVEGAVFLSNKGEVTGRAEAEYDLRITQKLVLQPRAEIDLSLQDIPELGVGAGLSEAALGARLRYQITPLFAPYVGVDYERAFGETADLRRDQGEDTGGWNLLAGVRAWF